MALKDRQEIMKEISDIRNGRSLICLFNFDRQCAPQIRGIFSTPFTSEVKEPLFRVLKETFSTATKMIDLCLYTRGGDTNAVWPIVNLLREFDKDFEVLVPFRCHSAGTLLSLGAKRINLTPLSELSPIDPTTGNEFNPLDPADSRNKLPISVEDTTNYKNFINEQFNLDNSRDFNESQKATILQPFIHNLTSQVHPLALGNVHRVLKQIKQLAENLLTLHYKYSKDDLSNIIENLTTKFYSHVHMINRDEAEKILGDKIVFADETLSSLLDKLLRNYEDDFNLRETYFFANFMGADYEKPFRYIGGAVESQAWGYLFETGGKVYQFSDIPPNIQIQMQKNQQLPLIKGFPTKYQFDLFKQGWYRNKSPKGVDK